jgi:hypothetical protein
MLFHGKLLKGKAVLAARNDQVHTQKIVDTGVRICTAGQLDRVMQSRYRPGVAQRVPGS